MNDLKWLGPRNEYKKLGKPFPVLLPGGCWVIDRESPNAIERVQNSVKSVIEYAIEKSADDPELEGFCGVSPNKLEEAVAFSLSPGLRTVVRGMGVSSSVLTSLFPYTEFRQGDTFFDIATAQLYTRK